MGGFSAGSDAGNALAFRAKPVVPIIDRLIAPAPPAPGRSRIGTTGAGLVMDLRKAQQKKRPLRSTPLAECTPCERFGFGWLSDFDVDGFAVVDFVFVFVEQLGAFGKDELQNAVVGALENAAEHIEEPFHDFD